MKFINFSMQFKIPQNIDIEEKIMPFLSLKQLFILLGGGAIDYFIYIVSVSRYDPSIYMIPVVLVLVLTLLIAFFKIENITFIKLVLLTLESIINPRTRFWLHYPEVITPLDTLEIQMQIRNEEHHPSQQKDTNNSSLLQNLEELTSVVDTSQKALSDTPNYTNQ